MSVKEWNKHCLLCLPPVNPRKKGFFMLKPRYWVQKQAMQVHLHPALARSLPVHTQQLDLFIPEYSPKRVLHQASQPLNPQQLNMKLTTMAIAVAIASLALCSLKSASAVSACTESDARKILSLTGQVLADVSISTTLACIIIHITPLAASFAALCASTSGTKNQLASALATIDKEEAGSGVLTFTCGFALTTPPLAF